MIKPESELEQGGFCRKVIGLSVNFVPKPAPTAIHKHTSLHYTHYLSQIGCWCERTPFRYIGETEAIQRVNDFHHAFGRTNNDNFDKFSF
ncbi:hypothetical protein [Coleofasciculus sp. E1-EBD-02]|uniref:hypothetical protein n=1 Tax=Coleofasciculus sp. E1-EBD-02 TaxID=3068481 RepID=UPI0040648D31